jgi:hypothetical protein
MREPKALTVEQSRRLAAGFEDQDADVVLFLG